MTKISKIVVKNLKKIENCEVEMNGGSIIVTAANESGKSSLIKSLIDRLTSEKSVVLREGQAKGSYIAELTDGAKIEWSFTEKSETFTYITKEGLKVTTGVISMLLEKYFGNKKRFEIDKFLSETPKKQAAMLCSVLNINLDEIENRYKLAYQNRADAKKEFDIIAKNKKELPLVVEKSDIDSLKIKKTEILDVLNTEIQKIKTDNLALRKVWELANDNLRIEIENHNNKNSEIANNLRTNEMIKNNLLEFCATIYGTCIDIDKTKEIYNKLPKPEPKKSFEKLTEPDYFFEPKQSENLALIDIDNQIEIANQKLVDYNNYLRDLKEYNEWIEAGKKARANVDNCEKLVKDIANEKLELIKNANLPEGFEFTEDGLLYNSFALNKNVQSTSAIYIAALKISTLNISELKTDYFEASALDKKNLQKVIDYANEKGLQLFIERPDYEGSEELRIEILENK